jgi:hypothetical protein
MSRVMDSETKFHLLFVATVLPIVILVAIAIEGCSDNRPTNTVAVETERIRLLEEQIELLEDRVRIFETLTQTLEQLNAAKSRMLQQWNEWLQSEGLEPGQVLEHAHVLHPGDTIPFIAGGV